MKNRNLKTWMTALFAFLLLTGFQVNAQRGGGIGPDHRSGYGLGHMNRLEAMLDLTDEQESEIEKLHLDFQKKSLSVRNKIREKNAQLNTLISEGADMNKVNQLVEEIGDLRTEVQKGMISTHMKVRNLLSDDQKVKYDNHFISRYGTPDHSGGFGRHGRGWN
jgi:Spy/CpxP family protein refolding chaperone